jgi:hypothetical protein
MSDDRLLQLRLVTEPAIYAQLSAAGKARVEELVPAGQPAMAFVLSEAARRMRQVRRLSSAVARRGRDDSPCTVLAYADRAIGVWARGLYRKGKWPIKRHLRTIRLLSRIKKVGHGGVREWPLNEADRLHGVRV